MGVGSLWSLVITPSFFCSQTPFSNCYSIHPQRFCSKCLEWHYFAATIAFQKHKHRKALIWGGLGEGNNEKLCTSVHEKTIGQP